MHISNTLPLQPLTSLSFPSFLGAHSPPPFTLVPFLPPHQDEALLDDIIERLLEVRNGRATKQVNLTEQEIRQLCLAAKEVFLSQPNLLELEAPIKICGTYSFASLYLK